LALSITGPRRLNKTKNEDCTVIRPKIVHALDEMKIHSLD
jgi:hypothetical protein